MPGVYLILSILSILSKLRSPPFLHSSSAHTARARRGKPLRPQRLRYVGRSSRCTRPREGLLDLHRLYQVGRRRRQGHRHLQCPRPWAGGEKGAAPSFTQCDHCLRCRTSTDLYHSVRIWLGARSAAQLGRESEEPALSSAALYELQVLYKWYKQATEGDVKGERPGLIGATMKMGGPIAGALRMRHSLGSPPPTRCLCPPGHQRYR